MENDMGNHEEDNEVKGKAGTEEIGKAVPPKAVNNHVGLVTSRDGKATGGADSDGNGNRFDSLGTCITTQFGKLHGKGKEDDRSGIVCEQFSAKNGDEQNACDQLVRAVPDQGINLLSQVVCRVCGD